MFRGDSLLVPGPEINKPICKTFSHSMGYVVKKLIIS